MKVLRNSLVLAALMVCGMTQAVPASDKNNDATEIAAFRKQLTDSLSKANVVTWNIPSELEPNAKMNFYLGVKGDKPENGYPVFLYLHGSGPRANEWATGLKLAKYFNDGPSMYIVPQIPQEGEWYRWWQRSKQWAWELSLIHI